MLGQLDLRQHNWMMGSKKKKKQTVGPGCDWQADIHKAMKSGLRNVDRAAGGPRKTDLIIPNKCHLLISAPPLSTHETGPEVGLLPRMHVGAELG